MQEASVRVVASVVAQYCIKVKTTLRDLTISADLRYYVLRISLQNVSVHDGLFSFAHVDDHGRTFDRAQHEFQVGSHLAGFV